MTNLIHTKSKIKKEESQDRTQFQIDRIAFFSDAVIAIAITLVVLEIKIPPLGEGIKWSEIRAILDTKLFTSFIILMICFVTIGGLWIKHHELFQYINNYNKLLIKINLYFLLSVVLLPISTSLLFEENYPQYFRSFIITSNLFACNLTYHLLLLFISYKKNNFSTLQSKPIIRKMRINAMISTIVFLVMSLLALCKATWFYFPIFVFPLMGIINLIKNKFKK